MSEDAFVESEPEPEEEEEEEEESEEEEEEEEVPPVDWETTELFILVKELDNLPPKKRILRAKFLESQYLNPSFLDIFTQEEADYYASLLQRLAT